MYNAAVSVQESAKMVLEEKTAMLAVAEQGDMAGREGADAHIGGTTRV